MEGNVLPKKGGFCSMGMTQHGNPGGWLFSSFHRATNSRLSSCGFSPLCPSSAGVQGHWLQTKFCVWPFKRFSASLVGCSCLFLADRNPAAFHSHMLFGFLSQFWCSRLWNSAYALDSILLRGNFQPLKYPSGTSAIAFWSTASHLVLSLSCQSQCGAMVSSISPWL